MAGARALQGETRLERADLTFLQRSEMIERTEWAHDFDWSQIKTLATYMDAWRVKQGELIIREGGTDAFMVLIIQGSVHITKEDSHQVPKVITTLGPGKTFGEMSLIDNEPRSASARTGSDALLFILTEENFKRLIRETPHLGVQITLKIAKLMSQRLRQTSGRLIDYLEA